MALRSIFGDAIVRNMSVGQDEGLALRFCCDLGNVLSIDAAFTLLGLTRVGENNREHVVAHSPGLPAAFLITVKELEQFCHRLSVQQGAAGDNNSVAVDVDPSLERCLMEAVLAGVSRGDLDGAGVVMQEMLFQCRKHAVALQGMTRLVEGSAALEQNGRGMNYSFPYYCSTSPRAATRSGLSTKADSASLLPAEKKYFDVGEQHCAVFHKIGRHGTKILSPFGIATCIGVSESSLLGGPTMFWHPAGEVAGRLAPILHGCRSITVGRASLECNGPSPTSLLTLPEDMHKFLNPSTHVITDDGQDVAIDVTKWMNSGLFDLLPGDLLPKARGDVSCVGVGYHAKRGMLDMFCRESSTGAIKPSFELI